MTNFGLTLKLLNSSKNFPLKKIAFKPCTEEFFKTIVNSLPWNEAAGGHLPFTLIKKSTFTFPYLEHCVNEDLVKSEFPDPLKLLNIVPVQKKSIQVWWEQYL